MSKRAIILSAVPVSTAVGRYVRPGDFIVACDAGYRNAERLDLRPDLIVGDFDSAPRPTAAHEPIVLPPVKDPTAVKYDSISYDEVLAQHLMVMDTTATSLSLDNHIPVLLFALKDPENIIRALCGENVGTIVKE